MPIPDFQSIMLPLLKFYANKEEHSTKDTIESLAKYFNLTEEELAELLPSRTQAVFHNRVHWAIAHLKMACLLESTKRAHYKITNNGLALLQSNPPFVNLRLLKTIPEYFEHTKSFKKDKSNTNEEVEVESD